MVAMHYILAYLASPTALEKLPKGRQTVEAIMALGCLVVLLFSLIFLFYTYSFLNRRRAREFGLYNVLGMGRRNISRIVLWAGRCHPHAAQQCGEPSEGGECR